MLRANIFLLVSLILCTALVTGGLLFSNRYRVVDVYNPLSDPIRVTVMVDSLTGKTWELGDRAARDGLFFREWEPLGYMKGSVGGEDEQVTPFTEPHR
jgi:hypothetical protein